MTRRHDHRPSFDLQAHSTCSDGALAPADVVRLAKARMAEALVRVGLHVDDGVLAGVRESGASIGRPHLARAVFEDRRNAARLVREGIERPEEVLQAYLLLDEACRSLDLLSTGSSDFHGPDHAIFSRFRAHPLHGLEPHLGPIASAAAAGS